MSEENNEAVNEDGTTDAVSTVLIILIPVMAVIYWLSSMPSS